MRSINKYLIILTVGVLLTGQTLLTLHSNLRKKHSFSKVGDKQKNKLEEGYPFISNFNFGNTTGSYTRAIVQDKDELMLFADRKGIIIFNGNKDFYFTFGKIPFSIAKNKKSEKIYVGCNNDFGYLDKKGLYDYKYISLAKDKTLNDNFTHIFFIEDTIWFCGEKTIAKTVKNKTEIILEKDSSSITGFAKTENKLLANISGQGLTNLSDSKTVNENINTILKNKNIMFSAEHGDTTILYTAEDGFYKIAENDIKKFNVSSEEYLNQTIVTGGRDIDEKSFAVLTLNGGAVLIDKNNGEELMTINYRTGLPDDEVFAGGVDNRGGLWLAHEYGVSRVALNLSIRNYGNYPGLEGKINHVYSNDSLIYVATGEGVYYLSEIKDYKEIEVLINKKAPKETTKTVVVVNQETEQEKEEPESKFNIFKNKIVKNVQEKVLKVADTESEKQKKEYKKVYELQSIKYAYKKIEDINGKCKQIQTYNNGLLVASNAGLYYIKDKKAKIILKDIYVNQIISSSNPEIKYLASQEGFYIIKQKKDKIKTEKINIKGLDNKNIISLIEFNDNIFVSCENEIIKFNINENDTIIKNFKFNTGYPENIILRKADNKILAFLSEEIYELNNKKGEFMKNKKYTNLYKSGKGIYFPNNESFIIKNKTEQTAGGEIKNYEKYFPFTNIFETVHHIFIDNNDKLWFVVNNNKLYNVLQKEIKSQNKLKLHIYEITTDSDTLENKEELKLDEGFKNLKIQLSAPSYLKKNSVIYYYNVNASVNDEFIKIQEPSIVIPQLSAGSHIIEFYAEDALKNKTEKKKIKIIVKPPFTDTKVFYLTLILASSILIWAVMFFLNKRKRRRIEKRNQELEITVAERTAEIQAQNEKIQAQNDEIKDQHTQILHQHNQIKESIRYAGKIQQAVLPFQGIFDEHFKEYLIYYKPRDVVSGDFYWINHYNEKIYVAAADCTGHGVPGGFLSMLGMTFLNEIVSKANLENIEPSADYILNTLRDRIINSLTKNEQYYANDGMDISLAIICHKEKTLEFAGANNPLYIIRDNELTIINADRMPIGAYYKIRPFKKQEFKLKENDRIYMFSDGFVDQMEDQRRKKFGKGRFQDLLVEIHKLPANHQISILDDIHNKWRKSTLQVDDMLILGLTI